MNRMKSGVIFLSMVFLAGVFSAGVGAETTSSALERKERDPFVALVDSTGKMKTYEDLFSSSTPTKQSLSADMKVKAILWDKQRPVVLINSKIYSEGSVILDGLSVQKINPDSVILNDQGNPVTIILRKTRKEK